MDHELLKELITLMREKDAQHAKMVEIMAASQTQMADVLRSWMELFKPPAQPLSPSTPDERAARKDLDSELTDWIPLSPEEMAATLAGLNKD